MSGARDAEARATGALAALDRRAFLRWTGLAVASGALPAACSQAPPGRPPPPDVTLRHLTPRTYAVLTAAAERIVGPSGGAAIAAGRVDPAAHADVFLSRTPELAAALGQALLALEFGVWPLLGKLRPFTALDGPDRDAILAELMRSRLALKRALFAGVKSVALLGYYGSPACQPVESQPYTEGVGVQDALIESD